MGSKKYTGSTSPARLIIHLIAHKYDNMICKVYMYNLTRLADTIKRTLDQELIRTLLHHCSPFSMKPPRKHISNKTWNNTCFQEKFIPTTKDKDFSSLSRLWSSTFSRNSCGCSSCKASNSTATSCDSQRVNDDSCFGKLQNTAITSGTKMFGINEWFMNLGWHEMVQVYCFTNRNL